MILRKNLPYIKEIATENGAKTIKKINRQTKKVMAEITIHDDGRYLYKKHSSEGPVIFKSEFDGKDRFDYLVQKSRNGRQKTILTRQLMKLNSFIEWCDMYFNSKGEIIKEVIKVKGVKIPKVQTDIPPKPVHKVKK